MLPLQELLKTFHVLPLRADKVFQTMATTRHLSPSDSLVSGGGSHLLTSVHQYYTGRMAQLTRDMSPGHHWGEGSISPELASPKRPRKPLPALFPHMGPGPRAQLPPWGSVPTIHQHLQRALHRSYANVVAKSSPFLITNVIVYAKLVCPGSDCLAPHPCTRGRQGPSTPVLQLIRVDIKTSQDLNLLVVLSRQRYCGCRGRIKTP